MQEQLAIQKILLTKYEEMRLRNPQFSRRAFSRRLGVSPGAISELFNGQRQISLKLAQRLADRLALDPQERSEIFALFKDKKKNKELLKFPKKLSKTDEVDSRYIQLSLDQFKIIGDWYHYGLLSLMRTAGFKNDPQWLAKRLGVPVSVVEGALERLKRLGLIQESKSGKLTRTKNAYRTSDDVANISVRRAHGQYLDKAREALETMPVENRDFTSLMFTCRPEQLARAKEMIRKFQDKLADEIEADDNTEVYQMCIQVFPLTKKQGD
ncbi:MAG: TIGR02147 family protein [Pseudobdellovibrionaceae bacterium]